MIPTNFQNAVYCLVRQIPKGKITTYKIIAEKLGIKAYRAVGTALKNNKKTIIIPCHRVVNSSGFVGAYKGIKNNKEKIKLLRKEGIKIKLLNSKNSKGLGNSKNFQNNNKILNFKKRLF